MNEIRPTTAGLTPTGENRPAYGRAGGPAGGLTPAQASLAAILAGIARRMAAEDTDRR